MWESFLEIAQEALQETIITLPILGFLFFALENIEHRFGDAMKDRLARLGKDGPVWGAIFGSIPQCSFSVLATVLFGEGIITTGTLLAVYVATSDEAIPVILAHPEKAGMVFPLLGTKIVLAAAAGLVVDRFLRQQREQKKVLGKEEMAALETCGCCGHDCSVRVNQISILRHAAGHAVRIYAYLYLITVVISLAIGWLGEEGFRRLLLHQSPWQPLVSGVLGLIPNCAVSVAIAEGFLRGDLSFASMIAGLSTNAGMGLVVLFQGKHTRQAALQVVFLLLLVGVGAGFLLEMLGGVY